jgi:hypothetical protein
MVAGVIFSATEIARGEPDTPPQVVYEDFGIHPFSLTREEVASSQGIIIASLEQRTLWRKLLALVRKNNGYHTAREVQQILGVRLKLESPDTGDQISEWKADLPNAQLDLLESGPKYPAGQDTQLTIIWDKSLKSPACISAPRAFAGIQLSGATGYSQVVDYKRFRRGKAGEEIEFSSDDLSNETCVSSFLLIGKPNKM